MTVRLTSYPASTPAVIPVVFRYRECAPFDFSFSEELQDAEYEYYVGETYPDIELTIAQAPCAYPEVFEAGFASDLTERPSWVTLTDGGYV